MLCVFERVEGKKVLTANVETYYVSMNASRTLVVDSETRERQCHVSTNSKFPSQSADCEMSGWRNQDEQFLHVHRPEGGEERGRKGEVIPVAGPQCSRSLATSRGIGGNYVVLF